MFNKIEKLTTLLFISIFLFSSLEASWITKKSEKKSENIKEEKKQSSEWIKLKKKEIKANKKEFKENELNISVKTKNWISKKSKKDTYKQSIEDLPNTKEQIYLIANSLSTGKVIYGYLDWDEDMFTSNLKEGNLKGKSYINDGKTICNIGVDINFGKKIIGTLSGDCTDKTQYNSVLEINNKQSAGLMVSSTGERFIVDLVNKKTKAVKKIASIENNYSLNDQPKRSLKISPEGNYYALLIGNSKYTKWSSLTSPRNDVTEISKILKKEYDFKKVITVLDGNRDDIFKAFKEIEKLSTYKDYVLIYYSGHGERINNQSFWIPVNSEKFLDSEWINITTLEGQIKNTITAHHIALVVDSCYFAVNIKGNKIKNNRSQAYKKLLDKPSRMILAAGTNEPVNDTNSNHSIFGSSIISTLRQNEDIVRMTDLIQNVMLAHANQRQQPYGVYRPDWGHGGGEFLFIKKKNK